MLVMRLTIHGFTIILCDNRQKKQNSLIKIPEK